MIGRPYHAPPPDPWGALAAVLAWAVDTCRSEADVDDVMRGRGPLLKEMREARPDLVDRLRDHVTARRDALRRR